MTSVGEETTMTCSRCGADAVVKREAAFYCGKCALARDWHEVIQIVQGNQVEAPVAAETPLRETAPDPFATAGA
jgi:hypothetical protein